ncbi:NAD(P)H-hydrate dehydratase [Paracoccus aerodenitrificans]|uniref:NAD(P)H-hydrate dehydratase n=1 Tax=Paracoccus aerodenitrificans TaxID=3017781 RepID=UPI0022F09D27|nr:NAD(P)H-hydrate dehydratase [Paracoccus aerodenitrificans]WBU64149.1 NAD(P)H-hydrate dehydratase [Paracoccus aerodenitrificans]
MSLPPGIDLLKHGGHKYDHGHALVMAGGPGQGGAARLAAKAALRIGAGLVTLAPPAAAMAEHCGPPDALMRHSIDTPDQLAGLLKARKISAIVMGPGYGVEPAIGMLPAIIAAGLPTLLDADALTALGRVPARLRPDIVLTPHEGEFRRLFPELANSLTDDRNHRGQLAAQAARQSGAVILLKGPDTVIAAPDGKIRFNTAHDVPWLATAGSGDVLSGLIGGLLARGFPPLDAASAAAHIHAECARRFGPGLIADDLPGEIPAILRDLA